MNNERPIHDAANQLAALAFKAAAMLEDLREGWLWQMLVQPPTAKKALLKHQPPPSNAT
jgi:hypothetical protein